jgi:hypothetical protein
MSPYTPDDLSVNHCIICGVRSAALHEHHVVPRSCGGSQGETIMICGQCHTTLHAHGSFLASKRVGNRPAKQFWSNPDHERRAMPYLTKLVTALLASRDVDFDSSSRLRTLSLRMTEDMYRALKLLKMDIGASSLESALQFCVQRTLITKGLTGVNHGKTTTSTKSANSDTNNGSVTTRAGQVTDQNPPSSNHAHRKPPTVYPRGH